MSPTNPPSGKPGDAGGSRPGKADWRAKAKTPATGSRPAGAPGGTWREKTDIEYRRAKRRYRMKLLGLVFGSVALVAWLAYLYVYPLFWRQTPFFAVVVTQYGPSAESLGYSLIPPNGWAKEDADRFELLTGKRIAEYSKVDYASWETTLEGFQDLRERIRKSRGGGPDRNALVVYLSMHGAVNKDGEACLIPPGVSPLESEKWLPLYQVLRYLFPEEDKGKLPARKLVILDCNRMDADWGLGLLYNGFADDLEAALRKADVPGLVLLNSTSPGQIGWTSPEQFQGSVFGYHVWRGLMGGADRGGEGNGDGEVSLSELAQYVSKYVRRWVQENRADVQVPMLVPGDAPDIGLAYSLTDKELAQGEKEWAPAAAPRDSRWKNVAELWGKHAALEKKTAWRNDPLGWEEFQHGLVQLERLVLSGEAYRAEFDKRRSRLADLAEKLGQDPLAPSVRAYSLPLASRFSDDPAVDAEADRLRAQWAKTPGKFAAEAGKQYPYLVAATAGWRWCMEHPEGDRWPDDLLAFVQKTRQGRKADAIEWHFVRMLQSYLDPEVRRARPDLLKQALLARQAAESAAAPGDLRVHYWLHNLVDAADADRRFAEDALFVGSSAALQQAEEKFAAAMGKDQSGGKYAEAHTRAKEIADAFALRDRAWARTPYLAEWVLARLHERDPAPPDQLNALVKATQELGRQLDAELANQREGASGESGPLPARLEAQKTVQQALGTLETAYQNECSRLSETTGTDREILRRLCTVLAVPLVTGEDRERLRSRYLDILESGQRAQPAANAEAAGADYRVAAGKQPGGQQDTGVRFLKRLARWSEHPALAMLSRAGLQEDEILPRKPAASASELPVGEGDSDRAAQELRKKLLAGQGGEVRRLLATAASAAADGVKQTEAKLRLEERTPPAAETRSGASKADRLLRASAGMLQTELAPWTEPGTDPVPQLRRLDLYYLLLWQCHRTLDDFWGPARNDPDEPSYFDVVAGEYLASAKDLCKAAAGVPFGKWNLRRLLDDRRMAAREPVRAVTGDAQVVPGDPATPLSTAVSQSQNLPPGEAALYFEGESGKQVLPAFATSGDAEKGASSGLRRARVAVPGDTGKLSCWVRSADLRAGENQAESRNFLAVALYRGHMLTVPFTATLPGAGVRIVYQPPVDPKTFVTVKGTQKAESYVIFILDYSGSMTKTISPDVGSRCRYEDARDTLLSILAKLAKVPGSPYRIGLMMYGHRVNYGSLLRQAGYTVPPDAEFVKRNPKNPREFISADADRIHPSEDVQWIWPAAWPPEAFTEPDVKEIREKLRPLLPMSETPLYLAVIQAIGRLNEIGGASAEGVAPSKHIVVITDGINYQSERKVGKADAAEKFAKVGSGIRLDIIAYSFDVGMEKEFEKMGVSKEEVRAAVDDLKTLARNHGAEREIPAAERGEFYSALDASALEKELVRSLRLSRYLVYRQGASPGEIAKLQAKDLDLPWEVPLAKADLEKEGGAPLVVKLAGSSEEAQTAVKVQGGEAILLYLSEDGKRLEHARYKFEERESRRDVPDPLDSSRRLYIAAHEPAVKEDGVHFVFSIQNNNEKLFSPRPAEAWVEIRPVLKNPEAAPLYVFYDVQFKPDCPVPVLECTAPNWPAEAEEAEVRLWCKFTKTPPDEALRLDQFTPKKRQALTLELRGQSDEKQDVHNVVIAERYPRGGDARGPFGALKVEMDPRPLRAVHHYIREAGIVRNTFSYPLGPFRSGQIPPYVVRVTLREEALKDAITVDPPLRVRIPRNAAR